MADIWRSIGAARSVHVHEHLYAGSIAGLIIGRLRRKCVVITQHMGALALPGRSSTAIYETGTRLLAFLVMRFADHVAFVSENVRQFFPRSAGLQARQTLVYTGLDTAVFNEGEARERLADRGWLGLDAQTPVVMFAGRFVRKKGLRLLRELATRMQDVTWLFAGNGPEDPAGWNLPNVKVLGRLKQADLARAYRAADALILPSKGEGFPLVVQEALACGAAVLSTEEVADACPEATSVIRTETYADTPDDCRRWEARLRQVLHDDTSPECRNARAVHATSLWSWERCARAYLGLLQLDRSVDAAATSVRYRGDEPS
jgi:glycosyltransferase involved in cell wall biosynthesis